MEPETEFIIVEVKEGRLPQTGKLYKKIVLDVQKRKVPILAIAVKLFEKRCKEERMKGTKINTSDGETEQAKQRGAIGSNEGTRSGIGTSIANERGSLGTSFYVQQPVVKRAFSQVPKQKTVQMVPTQMAHRPTEPEAKQPQDNQLGSRQVRPYQHLKEQCNYKAQQNITKTTSQLGVGQSSFSEKTKTIEHQLKLVLPISKNVQGFSETSKQQKEVHKSTTQDSDKTSFEKVFPGFLNKSQFTIAGVKTNQVAKRQLPYRKVN